MIQGKDDLEQKYFNFQEAISRLLRYTVACVSRGYFGETSAFIG